MISPKPHEDGRHVEANNESVYNMLLSPIRIQSKVQGQYNGTSSVQQTQMNVQSLVEVAPGLSNFTIGIIGGWHS